MANRRILGLKTPRALGCALTALAFALPIAAQETPSEGTRAGLPLPPGAKRTKQEQQDTTKPGRRGILDLVDPKRAKAATKEESTSRSSTLDVLRMTPGAGGDPLSGLSEDPREGLSEDLRTLLAAVNRSGAARDREDVGVPPHEGTAFEMTSTLGLPSWSERPTRDQSGRITGLVDANGNRFSFKYDKGGTFQSMNGEAVGMFNANRAGTPGSLRESEALGRFNTQPLGLGNPNGLERRFTQTRNSLKLPVSPFGGITMANMQPNGKRTFTTFDLAGRRAWDVDGNGGLHMNQYGPNGNLIGTYDANGKLTLFGSNGMTHTGAFSAGGTRVLVTPSGGTVLRTKDGGLINNNAPYYGMTTGRGLRQLPQVNRGALPGPGRPIQPLQQPGQPQWRPGQPTR